MNRHAITIAIRWVPLAFVICCFSGLTYLAVQQDYRQSANDPQIQMAEDAASTLSSGGLVQSVIPPGMVDIAGSLSPYVVIYDASGNPVAGDGILDGALPALPAGVFDSVRAMGGEDRITWQPRPGVRSAIVIDKISGDQSGFVMAGRSIREVEIREDRLMFQAAAVFIFALAISLLLVIAGVMWQER